MQPKMCIKCKKNIAVLFITKIENGVSMNEGYCLKCARSLGIPQIDEAVRQMGISEEELDMMTDEMGSFFGQIDENDRHDDDDVCGEFPMSARHTVVDLYARRDDGSHDQNDRHRLGQLLEEAANERFALGLSQTVFAVCFQSLCGFGRSETALFTSQLV